MAISHKHFHRHGAYLLRNSDMPGFSQGEQEALALLVAGHRGKLKRELLDELGGNEGERLARMIGILRLAALFKYVELLEDLPDFRLGARREALALEFPTGWLAQHPLTWQELQQEQRAFERLGLALSFS
jgi:exopolyphosphatase/guanosine-5'-triphosphate,3'-diphosphate pyrophosphatase